jgi:hypothetical protein
MNLKDRIQDIQNEYMQYKYVEHPSKQSKNPSEFTQMMQQKERIIYGKA